MRAADLPCLAARRKRGACNDCSERDQEHEDSRRDDQQCHPPGGQRDKHARPGGTRPPAHGMRLARPFSARALHRKVVPSVVHGRLWWRPDHGTK